MMMPVQFISAFDHGHAANFYCDLKLFMGLAIAALIA